jgi:hypothetical protein
MTDEQPDIGLQIDLTEFEKLRDEIDNRTDLSKDILLAELTALGAGLALVDKFSDILVGLAGVSTFLWLFWLDHTEQIYKIAAYIGVNLAPRLRGRHRGALQWEPFLRILDQGGRPAAIALGLDRKGIELRKTRNIGLYVMLLFIATTPLLMIAYGWLVLSKPTTIGLDTVRYVVAILVWALWLYGFLQYVKFRVTIEVIDQALLASAPNPGDRT